MKLLFVNLHPEDLYFISTIKKAKFPSFSLKVLRKTKEIHIKKVGYYTYTNLKASIFTKVKENHQSVNIQNHQSIGKVVTSLVPIV